MSNGESNWSVGMSIIVETFRRWVYGPSSRQDGEGLESLRSGLEYAKNCLAIAEQVAQFRQRHGALERLRRSREAVDAILRVLDRIEIFRDVDSVRAAIQELRRIGDVRNNPEGAARAFGLLLSSLGRLSSRLPFPANAYSGFLSESSEFFSNMLSALDPARRWGRREDWREAIEGGARTGQRGLLR